MQLLFREVQSKIVVIRNGDIVEYRQDSVSSAQPSAEQNPVAEREEDVPPNTTSTVEATENTGLTVRYWSDYSLVDYHPRSMQRLPDVPEWEEVEGDWKSGGETFDRFDEVRHYVDLTNIVFDPLIT